MYHERFEILLPKVAFFSPDHVYLKNCRTVFMEPLYCNSMYISKDLVKFYILLNLSENYFKLSAGISWMAMWVNSVPGSRQRSVQRSEWTVEIALDKILTRTGEGLKVCVVARLRRGQKVFKKLQGYEKLWIVVVHFFIHFVILGSWKKFY